MNSQVIFMKIQRLLRIVPILLATFIVSCSDDIVNDNKDNGPNGSVPGAGTPSGYRQCRGADISWLTQMEAEGIKFRYRSGEEGDCMAILKRHGHERVQVPPVGESRKPVQLHCRRAGKG